MAQFFGIASDIDGTLTHNDRRLSAGALSAAHSLSGRIPLVLVTGNTLCFSRTISKILGTRSPIIAENGGILLPDYDAAPIVIEPCTDELRAALSLIQENLPIRVFDFRERQTDVSFGKTVSAAEILPYLSDFPNISLVDAEFAFHLTDKNISKGAALVKMAEMMGTSADRFAAVGDSENDIDLFRVSGLSFAVSNAPEFVKSEADIVLENESGDGFAEAVRYLIENDLLQLYDEKRDFYIKS
ncbi:MAG: phosphoglycolate phosphatase [Methanosarcinales archaeon]|jgi:phosphoglycolate phosphatase (TIGR01487 family)|nr:phosphoglycolate phosphatase [Methanosarcinales archaeon]